MTKQNRVTAGVPAGGQYTTTAHAEPDGASLIVVRVGEPQPLSREELILTCQAVPGKSALSETTRQVFHARRQLAQAIKTMDQTMLNAAITHIKDVLPGAKELRLRTVRIQDARMVPAFVRTADDEFLGARYTTGQSADWASRTVEGADPGSVTEALAGISAHSEIWDTDPRCDYDPVEEHHIIYLDGRRRQEH